MSDGGKGDRRRPEDQERWDDGFDRIWGKKKPVDKELESEEPNED